MKKLTALVLILALLLLPGCGEDGERTAIQIYRVVAPYYQVSGELVRSEEVLATAGVSLVNTAIAAFNAMPSDPELVSPLPYGAKVLGYELRDGVLVLEVNKTYGALTGLDLTLANCCAALTFCSIEGVAKVVILCGDTTLLNPTAAADIITTDTIS